MFAPIFLVGCSFQPGSYVGDAGGDGRSTDARDATGCTTHPVPPAVNVNPAQWAASFVTAPSWSCTTAGTTTINSLTGEVTSTSCTLGAVDVTNNVAQTTGGPPVLVVRLTGLTITNDHVLRLIGDKPVVLLVAGNVVVDGGLVNAGAAGFFPGAGGSRAGECTSLATGLGTGGSTSNWGGGGGGYGTAGGQGGFSITNGGSAHGSADLMPLRGGCSGGTGAGLAPGAGGGAFQISASGTISIGVNGVANLSAGGGGAPLGPDGGGNGGGSGGAILLVSPTLAMLGASGALRANGGSGSEGCNSSCPSFLDTGRDGHALDSIPATDVSGNAGSGGNDQGRRGGLANLVGTAALVTAPGESTSETGGGRGGGGGGGGRLRIAAVAATQSCD